MSDALELLVHECPTCKVRFPRRRIGDTYLTSNSYCVKCHALTVLVPADAPYEPQQLQFTDAPIVGIGKAEAK